MKNPAGRAFGFCAAAAAMACAAFCAGEVENLTLDRPYSTDGAYLTINAFASGRLEPDGGAKQRKPGVWIRSVASADRRTLIAKLVPMTDGREVSFVRLVDETPGPLRLVTEAGEIEAAFADARTLLLRSSAKGLGVVLEFDGQSVGQVPCKGARAFFRGGCRLNTAFDVRRGAFRCEKNRLAVMPDEDGFEVAVIDNISDWNGKVPTALFDDAVASNKSAFAAFAARLPSVAPEFEAARLEAAKTLWTSQVDPRGMIRRHAMMMSKNWMHYIWSWDHVFNAMAIAYGDDDGGDVVDQFLCMFDAQALDGRLPDRIGDGSVKYRALKPPVHGWGLMRILKMRRLSDSQLAEIYGPLAKWTRYWLECRDRDGNGLCEYDDGCDSGWDNSSAFSVVPPVETPELQAYLVLQMEALAHIAGCLGRREEAAGWLAKADALAGRAIATLFDEDGTPRVRQAFTGEFSRPATMQTRLALLFGKRLPAEWREKIAAEMMSDGFLTPYGFATESVKSPRYRSDGYWLGPVWGPEMLLACDALKMCGFEKEANEAALRFCRLCAKSGFAENFDALTGRPRRDPAYTWTASAFLVMAHELTATPPTDRTGVACMKFKDGMLSATRPAGWLARALKLQSDGLTGHPEALSYPYDSCLWAGEIPRKGKHGKQWWRYEQTAYYTDGLLRLGYALGDKAFVGKGETGIDYTLDHASAEGQLGHPALWDATRRDVSPKHILWPMTVFFRAMKAKFDATHDKRIPAALAKYYLLYDAATIAKGRNTLAIEGMLWTYGMTGDRRLLDLAQQAWRMKDDADCLTPEKCADGKPIWMHGVTYSEGLKIPMLLFGHTGRDEYLRQAVNAEEKLVRDHLLPDGAPSSTEHTRGNSVFWGHETCDVADYTWSLGYFLEVTGDAKYADRIERCVFNAGFGAVSDDFRALQYFSNMNQFICTADSDHNPFKRGKTWMQYRPTHETECCAGNVQRILPNYVSRMWLKDAKGDPVVALYGPCEVDFGWAKIAEETRYPFDGRIAFRFRMEKPSKRTFTYRVPGWCSSASVKVNGKNVAAGAPGNFATIERTFADGDTIELGFPMEPVFETVPPRFVVSGKHPREKRAADAFANASQGTVVVRGPLVFAYPIPSERTQDNEDHANMNGKKSANPDFKCWNLRPAGPFNYALAAHRAEVVADGEAGDGFFKNPAAVKLRVPVRRIEWELDKGRFTSDVPENPVVLDGSETTIDLMPYGAAMLRLSVFPDCLNPNSRKPLAGKGNADW